MIIKIILGIWLYLSVIIVICRHITSSPFRLNPSIGRPQYYSSDRAFIDVRYTNYAVYVAGQMFTQHDLYSLYQYLVKHNPSYYFKLPRRCGKYIMLYNFLTGTIYVGCSRMPREVFKEIYRYSQRRT